MRTTTDRQDGPRDEELLDRARRGDRTALEALVLRYQPRVYRFGMQLCGDPEDAGDVLQDTMIAMLRSLHQFRGDAAVSTWLYSIARSFCVKKRRRSKFAPAEEASLEALEREPLWEPPDPNPDPEQQTLGRELDALLHAALSALPVSQREVLVLRDIEGLTAPEVAQVLGLSVEAVKSRLHRARLALRQALVPSRGTAAAPHDPPAEGCPDVLTLLSRHLEGEIDRATCAEMEAHLDRCRPCRDACESLRRMLTLCRAVPTPDVPPAVQAAVRAAIRRLLEQEARASLSDSPQARRA